jgi:branched-chain amino acid transport system substrate-binding protein
MDAVKAVQIAVDEANVKGGVNGRELKMVFQDDQYLTKNTVTAYRKMVDTDGAKIVLVANFGGVLALKDAAVKDGVIIIDPLDCNARVADSSKNLFCIATETESIGTSLAHKLVSQGKLKAGIMYSTKDEFMSLVSDAFRNTFAKAGGVAIVESFNYEDKDFKTQLTKIKSENPDALVLLGHDETGIIMKQARDLGLKAPFMTTGTITSPGAQEAARGYAEGTLFAFWDASSDNLGAQSLTSTFTKLVGRPPIFPLTTHPAYDAVTVLTTQVLPGINGDITAEKIRAGLLSVKGYKGVTGTITIDSNGAAPIQESVYKLVNGAPVKAE